MTKADAQKADAYMRKYRDWEDGLQRWRAFWNGGAPYMPGLPPRKPGPPPTPPTITNTACQQAAKIGDKKIFEELTAALDKEFRCVGDCPNYQQCKKKFVRSKGRGYSLVAKETYCSYTVRGDCHCGNVKIEA